MAKQKKQPTTEYAPQLPQPANSTDRLKELMQETIDQANKVMLEDRSKVLRLKGLVRQLEDVQRRII